MQVRPDFVIAGAAKCGTTALFTYLAQHPLIFAPRDKEPAFFCTDLPGGVATLDEYRGLFSAAPPRCLAFDASTRYLYSKVAIARIMAHNPATKIVVMLRNPVDAAYSLHGYAYRYGHEPIADFEGAWRAQASRPLHGPDTNTFEYAYGPIYRYAEQIRRLQSLVPENQRQIFIYEEFFADPVSHFARLLDFLSLPPATIVFSKVGEYAGAVLPRVEQALRRPPRWLRALYAPVRPLCRAARVHPAAAIRKLNFARRRKPALRPAFRVELQRYFAEDVVELERLLGRPLWRDVR
jgi:hypothetical protein